MDDVNNLKSHPDKKLFKHVGGVRANVQKVCQRFPIVKFAELLAIFHDLGKINPNFQKRVNHIATQDYSHHAYLSAYTFFCFCVDKENRALIKSVLDWKNVQNELIALMVLIAKHHSDLPDFCPKANLETEPYFLSRNEILSLYSFLEDFRKLPVEEYVKGFSEFKEAKPFGKLLNDQKVQKHFLEKLKYDNRQTEKPIDFFLKVQFAFAALIQSDKADAMDSPIIDDDRGKVKQFCEIYPNALEDYISKFQADSALNKLRTEIRKDSIRNLTVQLQSGKRIFELTAPTGSGKTIMLLSLASEIIKVKGDFRIMYCLPFLSITEQVEKEVLDIFKNFEKENFIRRIDPKTDNPQFERVQCQMDTNPSPEKLKELDWLVFQEQIFAYPFVITTFVRFFETLLSNHNATLLKLPNFSKSIFLIDEIQSLPPRLYTFFVAYLTRFCEKFDAYAVISTATQPNYKLPNQERVKNFFRDYNEPAPLLNYQKYFKNEIFNRYKIEYEREPISIPSLANKIIAEQNSVLIIVNTIDDSKELFAELEGSYSTDELYLLNTHFTPEDRKKKIKIIKERLANEEKVVLISTQLIEAGVDIDFPVLYRDFALVSSIVQSAGRCNRNGKLGYLGKVVLFNLFKEGKSRANLIYGRGTDKDILMLTKNALGTKEQFEERELLSVQRDFFNKIASELNFGMHKQNKFKLEFDFLEDIKECAFDKIGKFQLIDEADFGHQVQYYVPIDEKDDSFEKLLDLQRTMMDQKNLNIQEKKLLRLKVQSLLKKMSNQIVSVRLREKDTRPLLSHDKECMGIWKIHMDSYSFEKGIDLRGDDFLI